MYVWTLGFSLMFGHMMPGGLGLKTLQGCSGMTAALV